MNQKYDLVVVGGGASGFFAALAFAKSATDQKVAIFEKTGAFLSKVRISGGGRCNVTHACFKNHELVKKYPRGEKLLRNPFNSFSTSQTIDWFENRGVGLKTEQDGRVFPVTDSSATVINCFLKEASLFGVELFINSHVTEIKQEREQFSLKIDGKSIHSKKVVIASGGHHKPEAYNWIRELGLNIIPPVPSLFTFNIPNWSLADLMGVSVPYAQIKILTSDLKNTGPLLITHWGLSGPAIIQLSAFAALHLHRLNYQFSIHVHWASEYSEEESMQSIQAYKIANPKREVQNYPLFDLPGRLWLALCKSAGIEKGMRWLDLSKKQINKLLENLVRSEFAVSGKTTFKEEFVTCGGIDLAEINMETMECKKLPGLYFTGEVLNIDGITGGFNFQSAWTTGWIAGNAAAESLKP